MKRWLPPLLALGGALGWIARRRRREPGSSAPSDAQLEAELAASVRVLIEEAIGSYATSGAAAVEEEMNQPVDLALSFEPRNRSAASLSVSVYDGQIGVGAGTGHFELWPDREGSWRSELRDILLAVAEGRFSEEVSRGWLFERKVKMRFEGSLHREVHYASVAYGDEAPPPLGTFTYEPWT